MQFIDSINIIPLNEFNSNLMEITKMADKKYLDEQGLAEVANHVNSRLKTVNTMPESADEGAVRLFVGVTDNTYTKGHTYQYHDNAWVDITPSGGSGGVSSYNDLTDKPSINGEIITGDKTGNAFNLVNRDDFTEICEIERNDSFKDIPNAINRSCVFNNTLYVAIQMHGIYTSTDGVTFTQNTSFPTNYTIFAIIEYNNTLYVGVSGHGIWTSTDGETFTQNTSFPTNYGISAFCIFNDVLYVGDSTYGIWTSTDGNTFTQNTSFPTNYSISAFIEFKDTLYVGTRGYGIYTSTDGSTFTRNTSFHTDYTVLSFGVFKDTLYVGVQNHGIYISTDGVNFINNTSINTYYDYVFYEYDNALYIGTRGYGIYVSIDGNTFIQNTEFPNNENANTLIEYNSKLYIGSIRYLYTLEYVYSDVMNNIIDIVNKEAEISYDNSESHLDATTIQDAIDEVDTKATQAFDIACAVDADVRDLAEQGLSLASAAGMKATENAKNKLTKTSEVPLNPKNDDVILWTGNSGNFEKGHIYQYSSSQSQWNDISSVDASIVDYNNSSSGLDANNVQTAIDELKTDINNIHVIDDAVDVSYDNTTSELAATNVQSAIDEVNNKIDNIPTGASSYNDLQNKPSINGKTLVANADGKTYGLVDRNEFAEMIDSSSTQNQSFPTSYSAYAFIEFNNTFYVGSNHGIYVSTDGDTFTQISNSSFPNGYSVYAFIEYKNVLYVGTYQHGIYTSTDGNTFKQNTSLNTNYVVYALSEYDNTLYVGTAGQGIYRSTNGSTFTQDTSFPTDYGVRALIKYNNMLYMGTASHGIYRLGINHVYTQETSFPTNYGASAFGVFNNNLYVGTFAHGIYTLINGTFTQNTSFPTNYTVKSFIDYSDTLYVGTDNHSIYTSTDGNTFTQSTSFPTNYGVNTFIELNNVLYVGMISHGIYTQEMVLRFDTEPTKDSQGLMKSDDLYNSITKVQELSDPTITNIQDEITAYIKFNNISYIGTNSQGIYTSTDDITFIHIPEESFSTNISVTAFIVFNNTLYIGTYQYGIYTSTDGSTFTQNASFPTEDNSSLSFIEYNNTLYVGTYDHGIYTSTDGETFTQNASLPTDLDIKSFSVANNILYVNRSDYDIYSSTDGDTFNEALSFDDGENYINDMYTFNNTLYVGTYMHGMYTSTNGTFTQNESYPTDGSPLIFIKFNNILYVGDQYAGIYTSTDGSTFTQNESFPRGSIVRSFGVYNDALYATIGSDIYISTDGIIFTLYYQLNGSGTSKLISLDNSLLINYLNYSSSQYNSYTISLVNSPFVDQLLALVDSRFINTAY